MPSCQSTLLHVAFAVSGVFVQATHPCRQLLTVIVRMKQARTPRSPLTIGERTFDVVAMNLKNRNYSGITALSCDDTKLLSSLRLYYDSAVNRHFLVGAVDGPIEVPNPDAIEGLMSDSRIVRGTKVCVSAISVLGFMVTWCVSCVSGA